MKKLEESRKDPLPSERMAELPNHTEWDTDIGGAQIHIRPIRSGDKTRLQDLFGRLSASTIYWRFLSPKATLADREAARLANVDYHSRMALVATKRTEGTEEIIGVARYDELGKMCPGVVEAAIVVEDCYQGKGVGRKLMQRLIDYARPHRIHTFQFIVHPSNLHFLRLIQNLGYPTRSQRSWGSSEVLMSLIANPGAADEIAPERSN